MDEPKIREISGDVTLSGLPTKFLITTRDHSLRYHFERAVLVGAGATFGAVMMGAALMVATQLTKHVSQWLGAL